MSSRISTDMVTHSEPTTMTASNDTSMSQIGVLQSLLTFYQNYKIYIFFYSGPLSAPLAERGMFPRLPRPGRTSKCREIRRNKRAQWIPKNGD